MCFDYFSFINSRGVQTISVIRLSQDILARKLIVNCLSPAGMSLVFNLCYMLCMCPSSTRILGNVVYLSWRSLTCKRTFDKQEKTNKQKNKIKIILKKIAAVDQEHLKFVLSDLLKLKRRNGKTGRHMNIADVWVFCKVTLGKSIEMLSHYERCRKL